MAKRYSAPFLFSTQKRAKLEEKSHGEWVKFKDYEALRLAAIRVCVSDHPAQGADPAPEISHLWDLVGDFTDRDLAEAERQANEG